jgi:hypothetical protein
MANFLIVAGMVIVALCGELALFRIEARRHRPRVLDPGSYRFGVFGMMVYLVMYGVLTIVEKACLMIGKAPRLRHDDNFIDDYYIMNILHNDR